MNILIRLGQGINNESYDHESLTLLPSCKVELFIMPLINIIEERALCVTYVILVTLLFVTACFFV